MLKSLPENVENSKKKKKRMWHVFSDNAYDITCNTGKKCLEAERDMMQCLSNVFEPDHMH